MTLQNNLKCTLIGVIKYDLIIDIKKIIFIKKESIISLLSWHAHTIKLTHLNISK